MMKILPVSWPSRWFCWCLALALAGCGKGSGKDAGGNDGGFDGATAPYGPKTRTTQMHSTLTFSAPPGSGFTGINVAQITAVVGQKTIGGISYDRLATTRVDDPSKGGEYWIKENSDQTLDFAGFRHSNLAGGIVPAASMIFATPIKVDLEPPIGQPQAVTTSGTLTLTDSSATSSANVTGQYTLAGKGTTVATGVGPMSGCNHYSGQAASDSTGVPAVFRGQSISAELWYHPSFGVVAFNAPSIGIGTVMTDASDCGSIDSSGYRTIRKVAVVDSSSSFKLDTYDCDGNRLAADKNTHASMLLELRWVDETQAKTDSEPRPNVEFGVASGNYFPNTIAESPASIFHPEENGKGFKYWYSYVSQADKNEPVDSTAYHITVGAVPGLSPVRVTARIYYKVLPSLVGAMPDGGPNYGSRADSGLADGSRADSGQGGSSGQETILFKMESVAGVSYNPPQITTFTLPTASYITRVWTYHYGATIGTKSPTVAFKDTTSGTIFGPWAQVGYKSFAGTLGATRSDPGNVPGPPDNYWMAYPGQSVPAGTYQVIDSDPATWAYTADLGNRGVTWVYGYSLSGGGQDAGTTDSRADGVGTADAGIAYFTVSTPPAGITAPSGAKVSALTTTKNLGVGGIFWKDGRLFFASNVGGPIVSVMPGETGTLWADVPSLAGGSPSWRHGVPLAGGNILLAIDYYGGPTGLHEITPTGVDTPWTLASGHSGIGDIVALPSGGWVFSDFESYNIFKVSAKNAPETSLIPASSTYYTPAYLAHDALTDTVYFVNMNNLGGESWFGGDGAIYKLTSGAPVLVAKAPTGARFNGLAVGLGGLFPAGLYASDTANSQVVRVESTGTLTPFITGVPTPGELRIDPVSKGMALLSADQVLFFLGTGTTGGGPDAGSQDASVATDSRSDSTGGEAGSATSCNLIVNGNAEAAIGSVDGTPVSTPGWTSVGEATAAQYGVNGWPALTDPGPADRGSNLFSGGPSEDTSSLSQTVNVSQFASLIDASNVTYLLSGWLGGWSSQDDNAMLTVTFRNALGVALGTGSIGPVMASDRASVTGLVQRSSSGAVPSGTRTVLVVLSMARTSGSANDGYADDLSLVFGGIGASACANNPDASADGGNDQVTGGSDARADAQGSNGETGVFAVPPGSPESTETFDTPTSTTWVPIQAAGGDYTRFASVHDGELVVDVPAGNSWGKTGLRSKDPVFTVSDDMASNPYSVVLDFDSALTSGYVVALSPTVYDDIWTAQTVWAAFIRHPTAGGAYASLSNSQSTTDVAKTLTNVPLAAPASVAVTVRPAQAQFCSSSGWGLEGNFAWLKTGTPVYAYVFCHPYDEGLPTKMAVKEIRVLRGGACGPAQAIPAYTALPQKDVFSDAFATGTATNWAPIQAAGGNFTSFAKTTTGELFVDVPKGNSWGKTGIRSNFFFFDVYDDFATTPLSLTFAFDPLRTSGYAIVLSPTVYDDIWTASNVWTAFVRHPTAGGATASLTNTQNANDSSASLTNIPSQAPQTTTVSVRTNHVQVCTSAGWGMEGDYSWMVPGAKVYAYVFSHPFDEGMPSQVALRSVTAQRTAACGASGSIAPFPAPAVRTLFTDNFSTGYATNWTSIQAAGGDFAKFAKNTTGEVYVDVPAGNSWGKTGIRSSYFLFDVRDDYKTAPLQLKFTFDPARTKGYRVVLSTTVYDDIWTAQTVWTGYIYDAVANTGNFDLSNSQNTSDTSTSRTDLPTTAPATFTLTVGVQHVKAEQAGGYVLEGNFAWLTSGQKVYAYVFSHPALEGAASSFALQSVEAKR